MSPNCPGGTFPYVIVAGDTCYAIAKRFGTTVTALQAANPGLNCNNLQVGQQICVFIEPSTVNCPPGTQRYTIQSGDTCYAIARRFGTTVVAVQAANPGLNCNTLMVGQKICVPIEPSTVNCPPGSQRYTIQAGDTYWSLARRFNTTVQAIQATNPGVNPNNLVVGQKICIPTT